MKRYKAKHLEEVSMKIVMSIAAIIVLAAVLSIIATIFVRGCKSMTWELVSQFPGKEWNTAPDGGFLNAILGSLYVVLPAAVIGGFVSIPVVFFYDDV